MINNLKPVIVNTSGDLTAEALTGAAAAARIQPSSARDINLDELQAAHPGSDKRPIIAPPQVMDARGAFDILSDDFGDIFALMRLLIETFKSMRQSARDTRELQQHMSLTAARSAASELRKAGRTALTFALVSAGVTAVTTGLSIRSACRAGTVASTDAKAKVALAKQRVQDLGKLKTAQIELGTLQQKNPTPTAEIASKKNEIHALKKQIGEIRDAEGAALALDNPQEMEKALSFANSDLVEQSKYHGGQIFGKSAKATAQLEASQRKVDELNQLTEKQRALATKQATLTEKRQAYIARQNAQAQLSAPTSRGATSNTAELNELSRDIGALNKDIAQLKKDVTGLNEKFGNRLVNERFEINRNELDQVRHEVINDRNIAQGRLEELLPKQDARSLSQKQEVVEKEATRLRVWSETAAQGGQGANRAIDGVGQLRQSENQAEQRIHEGASQAHEHVSQTARDDEQALADLIRSILEKLKAMIDIKNQSVGHTNRV